MIEAVISLQGIYVERDSDYTFNRIFFQPEEMNEFDVTLGRFNNSLNFVFGLAGDGLWNDDKGTDEFIDILNNPYVDFFGYEMDSNLELR